MPASTVGDYFSGRHLPATGQEDSLLRILTACGESVPLIVVGPSGSGKSSLLRAGLMAQLTGPVALFVPTATPAADFAAVVADLPAPAGLPARG